MSKIDLEKYHKIGFASGITMVMHWIIKYEPNENENKDVELPGEEYDPKEDYSPKYVLKDEVQEWLNNNATGMVYIDLKTLYFENAEDAMAFKLRWI